RVHLDRDVAVGARGLVELGLVIDTRHPTMMPDPERSRGRAGGYGGRAAPHDGGVTGGSPPGEDTAPGRNDAARDGAHQRALASRIALRQTVRMMSESQALETLSREDPEAAGDARAALAWLTGDEGLETISLLRLQEFLWYALPVKWPMSTPGRVGV